MKCFAHIAAAAPLVLVWAAAAQADVTISTHATAHMSCVSFVCTATGAKAYLNVGQLQTMLASGSVAVRGTAQAPDIVVASPLAFSSTNSLGLDAYRSVLVRRSVDILSAGGLSITFNNGGGGGAFTTGPTGNVHFSSTASSLVIDNHVYALASSLATLASAVQSNPNGYFALAADYNSAPDGEYALSPVTTVFGGHFDGLGHTLLKTTIRNGNKHLGLFAEVAAGGVVQNLSMKGTHIHSTGPRGVAGAIAAVNNGTLRNVHLLGGKVGSTGEVTAIGGAIAGINTGTILLASGSNQPQNGEECGGGLVGQNSGLIGESHTEGKMIGAQAGGIACSNSGTIRNSYSLTAVTGRNATPYPGGLVSQNLAGGTIATSYAAGQVTAVSNFGAIAGNNAGTLTNDYWDIQYTGAGAGFGCGSGSCAGATALDHSQIQAALPGGFDPAIWALSPAVNGGWPYLIANPPR